MSPRLILLSVCAFTAVSCTAHFKPGTVQTASIKTPMRFAKRMTAQTRGEVWASAATGVVGGLVGGAISGAIISGSRAQRMDEETLRTRFEQDLRRMLKEELEARGQFRIVEGPADATIEVSVLRYGYGIVGMGGAFSGKQGPLLSGLYLWMRGRDGKRLWNTYGNRPGASRVEEMPVIARESSAYENDPELLLRDLNVVARWHIRRMALEIPAGRLPSATASTTSSN